MPTRRDAMKLLGSSGVGLAVGDALFLGAQTADSELLIRRGRVVNADGLRNTDVRVIGETIAEIGAGLKPGPALGGVFDANRHNLLCQAVLTRTRT